MLYLEGITITSLKPFVAYLRLDGLSLLMAGVLVELIVSLNVELPIGNGEDRKII